MWRSIDADEVLKHSNIPPVAVEGLAVTGERECTVIIEWLTSHQGQGRHGQGRVAAHGGGAS